MPVSGSFLLYPCCTRNAPKVRCRSGRSRRAKWPKHWESTLLPFVRCAIAACSSTSVYRTRYAFPAKSSGGSSECTRIVGGRDTRPSKSPRLRALATRRAARRAGVEHARGTRAADCGYFAGEDDLRVWSNDTARRSAALLVSLSKAETEGAHRPARLLMQATLLIVDELAYLPDEERSAHLSEMLLAFRVAQVGLFWSGRDRGETIPRGGIGVRRWRPAGSSCPDL